MAALTVGTPAGAFACSCENPEWHLPFDSLAPDHELADNAIEVERARFSDIARVVESIPVEVYIFPEQLLHVDVAVAQHTAFPPLFEILFVSACAPKCECPPSSNPTGTYAIRESGQIPDFEEATVTFVPGNELDVHYCTAAACWTLVDKD